MIRRISFRRVSSSLQRIIALRHLLAVTAIAIGFSSCYNEPEIIGGDLLPSEDLLSVKFDTTFKVSAYTDLPDTIITNGFSDGVIGCLNSKIFGKTKSDFLTQVLLGVVRGSTPLFGTLPVLDSLELRLKLKSYYGNKNQPITVNIYELKDTLSSYVPYNGLAPVDNWNEPTKLCSITYSGDTILRIRFNYSFAKKILDADLDSARVSSNKNFKQYFKGFYITCDDIIEGDGVMYFFDFTSSETTMKLYYKNPSSSSEQKIYTFSIGSSYPPPRFNHFIHDYNQADPAFKLDTLTQDSVFYIEGLGGARGLIKFDGIENWLEKMPIAINRAELRLELGSYPAIVPNDLIVDNLFYFVDETSTGYTQDQKIAIQQQQNTYVTYNKAKQYYSINLTAHIQSILTGRESKKTMFVIPLNSSVTAARNIIRTGKNSNPMKLIITYSKL